MPRTEPPGVLYLSTTHMNKLLQCEQSWLYYRDQEMVATEAMRLGTLLHRLAGAWWTDGDWQGELRRALEEEPGWEDGFGAPQMFDHAAWVMFRYDEHWKATRDQWTPLSLEVPFDLPLATGSRVRSWIDGVFRHRDSGETWVWEFKSMSSWNRMNWVGWDPQIWLYMWALRQVGVEVAGAVFDGIGTYRYKTPRPPADSFRRVVIPWDTQAADVVMAGYREAAFRAGHLQRFPEQAVKALGSACVTCQYRQPCHGPLGAETATEGPLESSEDDAWAAA